MLQAMTQIFQQRYHRWLNKRIPAQAMITLNNRKIFIFLSSAGFAFCGMLIVMLVMAINYQNNMVFASIFLLASLMVVTILHSYLNLSGLTIELLKYEHAFCDDNAVITVRFTGRKNQSYHSIRCLWMGLSEVVCSLEPEREYLASFHLPMSKRGVFKLPRLLIESRYPLGLFRAWTWLSLKADVLVYPKPIKMQLASAPMQSAGYEQSNHNQSGVDDFYGFKSYQPGHSLKQLHWPSFAKGQPLQTKEFSAQSEQALVLNWYYFNGTVEQKLSAICYWLLQFSKSQQIFTVVLPNKSYGPDSGLLFQRQLLKALALYPAAINKGEGNAF